MIGNTSLSDNPDLLELCFVDAEKFCHLDNLIRIDEIGRIRAELLHARREFATSHRLWHIEAETAGAIRVMHAEFTDNHI